jgi:hypothetical protein
MIVECISGWSLIAARACSAAPELELASTRSYGLPVSVQLGVRLVAIY